MLPNSSCLQIKSNSPQHLEGHANNFINIPHSLWHVPEQHHAGSSTPRCTQQKLPPKVPWLLSHCQIKHWRIKTRWDVAAASFCTDGRRGRHRHPTWLSQTPASAFSTSARNKLMDVYMYMFWSQGSYSSFFVRLPWCMQRLIFLSVQPLGNSLLKFSGKTAKSAVWMLHWMSFLPEHDLISQFINM